MEDEVVGAIENAVGNVVSRSIIVDIVGEYSDSNTGIGKAQIRKPPFVGMEPRYQRSTHARLATVTPAFCNIC